MLYNKQWDVQVEPWRQKLLDAIGLIEECGWVQHQSGTPSMGFCISGAISEACSERNHSYWEQAGRNIYRTIMDKVSMAIGHGSVPSWNDNYRRTKEEVLEMLKRVAAS